jgi:hypothetical protein
MPDAIEIDEHGLPEVIVAVAGVQARATEVSRKIIEQSAQKAFDVMQLKIPKDSGHTAERMFIDDSKFHLGGRGGGGYWETAIRFHRYEGTGFDPLTALVSGTGRYGRYATDITAKAGGVFRFQGTGNFVSVTPQKGKSKPGLPDANGFIYRTRLRGVKSQTDWIHEGQAMADKVTLVQTFYWGERLKTFR